MEKIYVFRIEDRLSFNYVIDAITDIGRKLFNNNAWKYAKKPSRGRGVSLLP